jgi:UDP-GlcNAc:undecaprenyl-phosphate GlcNAc-1-phosphate transferase
MVFARGLPEKITASQLAGVIMGATLLGAAGGLDDRREMRPLPKLLAQIICAAVAFTFGVRLRGVFGYPIPGWVSGLATIIWIVAIVNAINFIDGLDGLAAGVSAIAAVSFAYLGAARHDYAAALMAASLAGASLGFLPHNFSPAKVFMGDMGSQFTGFLIASIALLGTLKTTAAAAVLSAGLILAVPIGDTAFAVVRRIARRQPPFVADADHIHHRLVRGGLSDRQAVLLIYFASAALSLVAVLLAKKS